MITRRNTEMFRPSEHLILKDSNRSDFRTSALRCKIPSSTGQVFESASQVYQPNSPSYVPASPDYVATSPAYIPTSPCYVAETPAYVPTSPNYVAETGPTYIATSPSSYVTTSPSYVQDNPIYNLVDCYSDEDDDADININAEVPNNSVSEDQFYEPDEPGMGLEGKCARALWSSKNTDCMSEYDPCAPELLAKSRVFDVFDSDEKSTKLDIFQDFFASPPRDSGSSSSRSRDISRKQQEDMEIRWFDLDCSRVLTCIYPNLILSLRGFVELRRQSESPFFLDLCFLPEIPAQLISRKFACWVCRMFPLYFKTSNQGRFELIPGSELMWGHLGVPCYSTQVNDRSVWVELTVAPDISTKAIQFGDTYQMQCYRAICIADRESRYSNHRMLTATKLAWNHRHQLNGLKCSWEAENSRSVSQVILLTEVIFVGENESDGIVSRYRPANIISEMIKSLSLAMYTSVNQGQISVSSVMSRFEKEPWSMQRFVKSLRSCANEQQMKCRVEAVLSTDYSMLQKFELQIAMSRISTANQPRVARNPIQKAVSYHRA